MVQFEPRTSEITQAGAQLVYIAAEKRHGWWKPAAFLSKHRVSFPFLLDEDASVTKAYGLYHAFGHDAFHIAHPASLVVSPDSVVRYIYRSKHQLDRAPIERVIKVITDFKTNTN